MSAIIRTEKRDGQWFATVTSRPFLSANLKVFVGESRAEVVDQAAAFAKNRNLPLAEVM